MLSLALGAMMALFAVNNVFANCNPNSGNWVTGEPIIYSSFPSSTYDIVINYEISDDPSIREIRLTELQQYGTNPNIEDCLQYSIQQLLSEASWLFGYDQFVPITAQIDVIIAVPCCWQGTLKPEGYYEITPCNYNDCCINKYQISWDEYGVLVISAVIPQSTCTSVNCVTCTPICDAVVDIPRRTVPDVNNWCFVCNENNLFEVYEYTGNNTDYQGYTLSMLWHECDDPDIIEVYISEIQWTTGAFYDVSVLRKAVDIALGYFASNAQGPITIRIALPCVYKQVIDEPYFDLVVPCVPGCCGVKYVVEAKDVGGGYEIYYRADPQDTLSGCLPDYDDFSCNEPFTCDYDDEAPNNFTEIFIDGRLQNDPPYSFRTTSNDADFEKILTYVKPNPTTGLTDIFFESDIAGILDMEIYDPNGKLISKQGINKSGTEAIFHFDATNYSNGVYAYYIKQDGKIIVTGKFVVSK